MVTDGDISYKLGWLNGQFNQSNISYYTKFFTPLFKKIYLETPLHTIKVNLNSFEYYKLTKDNNILKANYRTYSSVSSNTNNKEYCFMGTHDNIIKNFDNPYDIPSIFLHFLIKKYGKTLIQLPYYNGYFDSLKHKLCY